LKSDSQTMEGSGMKYKYIDIVVGPSGTCYVDLVRMSLAEFKKALPEYKSLRRKFRVFPQCSYVTQDQLDAYKNLVGKGVKDDPLIF